MTAHAATSGEATGATGTSFVSPVENTAAAEKRVVVRWNGAKEAAACEMIDLVARETTISITLNGRLFTAVACSPAQERELVIGMLRTEGVIKSLDEVECLLFDERKGGMNVIVQNTSDRKFNADAVNRVRASGCGAAAVMRLEYRRKSITPLFDSFRITPDAILETQRRLQNHSRSCDGSGCLHYAALLFESGEMLFHEDIGRHNAVDKAVGSAMIGGYELRKATICCSGRISSEMLAKAAEAGIPVVISRSAPTTAAVDAAREFNVTLLGFARGVRFNIYSGQERILSEIRTVAEHCLEAG